jgi:hypothetical protein
MRNQRRVENTKRRIHETFFLVLIPTPPRVSRANVGRTATDTLHSSQDAATGWSDQLSLRKTHDHEPGRPEIGCLRVLGAYGSSIRQDF